MDEYNFFKKRKHKISIKNNRKQLRKKAKKCISFILKNIIILLNWTIFNTKIKKQSNI